LYGSGRTDETSPSGLPGHNGKIAFVARPEFTEQPLGIYAIDPTDPVDNEPTLLADNATGPAFSPDGEKMAFEREGQVWLMNADGSEQLQLTHSRGYTDEPSWFPDGRKMAVLSNRGGSFDAIYILTLNVARTRVVGVKLLTDRGGPKDELAVSPSGDKIAYTRSLYPGSWSDLFVLKIDAPYPPFWVLHPTSTRNIDWSPDGKKIVFGTYWLYESVGDFEFEYGPIYSISARGRNLTQLTPDGGWNPLACPVYSPDGKQIAFFHDYNHNTSGVNIWRIKPDGTEPVQLANLDRFNVEIWWWDLDWQALP
jgi:Tol biopolymer transport system component